MKIVAIIQARISSTRLPGKVLMKIGGEPMIWYVVKRTKWAKYINKVVIATSIDSSDDPIVDFCQKNKVDYFRGDLEDVLSRYYHAAKNYQADVVVRITADCPLIDGTLIDQGLAVFKKSKVDYLSNTIKRTFPRGFDFEIFAFEALEKAYKNATEQPEREHVTPYIYQNHTKEFRIKNLKSNQNKSKYRITVDTEEDLKLIRVMIEKFGADEKDYNGIITIMNENPEISAINQNVKQKSYGE